MRSSHLVIAAFWFAALVSTAATADDYAKYLWEFPVANTIRLPDQRQWMLEDLRAEVDKVLEAGHLAPYYFNACDLHHEGYFLYVAPGRIITTLAWAFPHLTEARQAKTRQYVAAELANPHYAPWAGPKLPWKEGTGREGLGPPKAFNCCFAKLRADTAAL